MNIGPSVTGEGNYIGGIGLGLGTSHWEQRNFNPKTAT